MTQNAAHLVRASVVGPSTGRMTPNAAARSNRLREGGVHVDRTGRVPSVLSVATGAWNLPNRYVVAHGHGGACPRRDPGGQLSVAARPETSGAGGSGKRDVAVEARCTCHFPAVAAWPSNERRRGLRVDERQTRTGRDGRGEQRQNEAGGPGSLNGFSHGSLPEGWGATGAGWGGRSPAGGF